MIRLEVETDQGHLDSPKWVRVVFGPHHFVEIYPDGDRVMFSLGATHHGICLDASDVCGDLENVLDNLKESLKSQDFADKTLTGTYEYETVVDRDAGARGFLS